MILLDTNVVSAVMASKPDPNVVAWLDGQPAETLYLPTIAIAEIGFGLAVLADGRRKRDLAERFEGFVAAGFAHRILPFGRAAADLYGPIMAHRRGLGRPMSALDGQVAAIAKASHLAVATRNVRDFDECGLEIVNPFEAASDPSLA